MRRIAVGLASLSLFFALQVSAAGQSAGEEAGLANDPCAVADIDESAAADCASDTVESAAAATTAAAADPAGARAAGFPSSCRMVVDMFAVTINDTLRIARALAGDPSPCAEYYVVIPSVSGNRTMPRGGGMPAQIRALGDRFHAVAEVTLGTATGWINRVAATGMTWEQAGIEFRTRMAAAGYDVADGDTWLLNEFNEGTRRDTGPTRRPNMMQLVRGLHDGGALADEPGAAEIGIAFSHQNLPDVPQYKAELKSWLLDAGFWDGIDPYLDWTLREVYADSRYHGVPGTSRAERRRHLEPFQQHLVLLAEAGPAELDAARAHLRRTYGILMNGAWGAPGGDKQVPPFVGGHGMTQIPGDQMLHFISEQVHAARHFLNSHADARPALGFSWQQTVTAATIPTLNAMADRMASSLHYAFREGGASPAGACARPDVEEDWCQMSVAFAPPELPAAFTEEWEIFRSWE